jgi:hypothetical protein
LKLAAHYLKLAADQGIAVAQNNYGICLQKGEGVSIDFRGLRTTPTICSIFSAIKRFESIPTSLSDEQHSSEVQGISDQVLTTSLAAQTCIPERIHEIILDLSDSCFRRAD